MEDGDFDQRLRDLQREYLEFLDDEAMMASGMVSWTASSLEWFWRRYLYFLQLIFISFFTLLVFVDFCYKLESI